MEPLTTENLRLANGLRVSLLHAPWLRRAAAAVRIEAGSHDAPAIYPGLAHFLEHLVFLGSQQFAAEDGLLPLVQAHGGQVNASTRERHTDYFFELPVVSCAAGLARLCDMLARPSLSLEAQLAEREVLHAEFLAWSRDTASAVPRALGAAVPVDHPLSAFHAGNRFSLPLRSRDFQRALREFHRCFYQAGQASLVLLGPQPLAELRRLVEAEGARFGPAVSAPRPAPKPLLPLRRTRVPLAPARPGLGLVFLLEDLPPDAGQALEFLCHCLTDDSPGGWPAQLCTGALSGPPLISLPYLYSGQALLQIDLPDLAAGAEDTVIALLFDWLRFFTEQHDWVDLAEEYALQRARLSEVLEPLALARQWLQAPSEALSVSGRAALRQVLAQLDKRRLVLLPGLAGAQAPVPSGTPPRWRLPAANPWLRQAGIQGKSAAELPCAGLQRGKQLPQGAHGALFLRWSAPPGWLPARAQCQSLQTALQPLTGEARRAGLSLAFNPCGAAWELALGGPARLLPALLEACLKRFTSAPEMAPPAAPASGQMLLRRLWQHLERSLATSLHAAEGEIELTECRWDGLALGLDGAQWSAVRRLVGAAPGHPREGQDTPLSLRERLWQEADLVAGESALLLFCPTNSSAAADQARWRLLGQLLQGAFYQRCRRELRLGYGVFSGYRQVGELGGLLFAVQSPHASTGEILAHVEDFLRAQQERLKTLGDAELARQRECLLAQLEPSLLAPSEATALLWQAHKEGRRSGLEELHEAVRQLDSQALYCALQALREAADGWFCLGSGPAPDKRWRALSSRSF
ncbi:pyrroloquinoline quinone biosynthesis protein PqqF [Pseudomonas aeruginosa]